MCVLKYEIIPATLDEVVEVDRVSALPVGIAGQLGSFGLYTTATRQFIAYYDADRRLRVAARTLADQRWIKTVLPETLGWDSHNYVTLAVDAAGHVHVSGNMHASPLCYFRSVEPGDVTTLKRISSLTGTNEDEVTYPRFLRDVEGSLLFTYRDGRSGAGNQIFKVYDHRTQRWCQLHSGPLIDGQDKRNAYLQGPRLGPDGYFHICWVWRDGGDAASTHRLCYARSRDLRRWETSNGAPIELPITFEQAEIVDPVGHNAGLINNNHLIGFDARGRVVISYQKYDEFGNTQIYQARRESAAWMIYRTTDWAHRWEIRGPGSLVFELQFGPVVSDGERRLVQSYRHARRGAGTLILDAETLETIGHAEGLLWAPRALEEPVSSFPGMQVNWAVGEGEGPGAEHYMLRWETLPENRDTPRSGSLPEPGILCLYKTRPGRAIPLPNGPLYSFYWRSLPHFPASRESLGVDHEISKKLKRPNWMNRLIGWTNNILTTREISESEGNVEAQAQAAVCDWAEAVKQSQRVFEKPPERDITIGEAKLNVSVARRLARLDAYRRHIASYAAIRSASPVPDKKVAIYTAIVGDYDSAKLPEILDPRFDYVLFSDTPRSGGGVWAMRPISAYYADPTRTARYVKMHPHTLLGDYDVAIWIDSSIMILGDIHDLLEAFINSGQAVGAVPHPYRTSIYEEIEVCIDTGRDATEVMREQVARYSKGGFAHQDLIESNLMMFDLTQQRLHSFLDCWWSEIDRGSKRDQLSLNYALMQTSLGWHPVTSRPDSARNHPMLAFGAHDRGKGVARRLIDELGVPMSNPYEGVTYEEVREQRITAQSERCIDIVICVHNAHDYVMRCLESVRQNRRGTGQRIIVVDDGSDAPTAAFLRDFANDQSWIELIRNDVPTGYARAANRGLAASRGEFVILLNSDTIVTDGWAEKMADAVFSTPGAGVVGPMSNAASHQSIPDHRGTEQQTAINVLPPGLTADDMNRYCEKWTIAGLLPQVQLVHGFCFGVIRDVIERIGYFDESRFPRGYGEENDYCFRVTDAGFGLIVATHTYVFHAKSKSYAYAERVKLMREASNALQTVHSPARLQRAVVAMEQNPFLHRIRQEAEKLMK